ncbi:tRNA lysidine(34) synthetase TilS, partial [Enterococcus faecalis]
MSVRHRQSGDRITLQPGVTKKISRGINHQKGPTDPTASPSDTPP